MGTLWRSTVTHASRVMLPTYPLVYALVGMTFVLQSPLRTGSPTYDIARDLMPITSWGYLFTFVAIVETAALLLHERGIYLGTLIFGAGLTTFWAMLIFWAACTNPTVSFSASYWLFGMAVAHAASARSLASMEI